VLTSVALGIYVSDNRLRLNVRYLPEPILGEAACHAIYGSRVASSDTGEGEPERLVLEFSAASFREKLAVFVSKCITWYVSAGTVGEIMGRVILSLAFDRIHLRRPGLGDTAFFSQPVAVPDFVAALMGGYGRRFREHFGLDDSDGPITIPDGLRAGTVCFTSWEFLPYYNPYNRSLAALPRMAYRRKCAVVMPPNHCGADLLIPIQVVAPDGVARYSYILVQMKNRVRISMPDRIEAAGLKLTPRVVFELHKRAGKGGLPTDEHVCDETEQVLPEYLALYMEAVPESLEELASQEQSEQIKAFRRDYPWHGMLLGFDYACPEEALLEAFKSLHRRHMETFGQYDRMSVVKTIAPVACLYYDLGCACGPVCAPKECPCRLVQATCHAECSCRGKKCHNPYNRRL
jgi:hypothetical protein